VGGGAVEVEIAVTVALPEIVVPVAVAVMVKTVPTGIPAPTVSKPVDDIETLA